MAAKSKCWSYNAGERGRNWVRAYEKAPGGIVMLEYFEPVYDADKRPVIDPATGEPQTRKARKSTGHRDRKRAIREAEELAERFKQQDRSRPVESLRELVDRYTQEVTPTKGDSKQGHDRRAAVIFRRYFDAQPEKARRFDRSSMTLDKKDWDGFKAARFGGWIEGFGPVGSQQVRHDLQFLLAVLAWASGAEEHEPHFIPRNPWRYERRKAQGMTKPKELRPKRPGMSEDRHGAILAHSPDWRFTLVMELCRETIHRMNSVRQLRWSDIDFEGRTVRWRGEFEKSGREAVTPLSRRALEALQAAPRVLGSPWVVPAEKDAQRPVPRVTLHAWMAKAKAAAGVEVRGLGFHGQKRGGVRTAEFRALPAKVQEFLTSTNAEMLREVYDEVGLEDAREAVEVLERARRRA
jgi:integrase